MRRLARKVSIAKWKSAEWAGRNRLPADAFADLRTSGNTLSFWQIDPNSDSSEEDAILALIGTLTCVEKIDVVILEESELTPIELVKTEGKTCIPSLCNLHVDACGLDQSTLISAATALGASIYDEKYIRFTRAQVRERLRKALDEGRLDWQSVHPDVKKTLQQ